MHGRLSHLPDARTIIRLRGTVSYPERRLYRLYMELADLSDLSALIEGYRRLQRGKKDEHGRPIRVQRLPKQAIWGLSKVLVAAACLMRLARLPKEAGDSVWPGIPIVKVGDFGLGHPDDSETVANPGDLLCGTQGYVAREQQNRGSFVGLHRHTSATNVWAIGRIMQELMEMQGRNPMAIFFNGQEHTPGGGPEPRFPIASEVIQIYGQELVNLTKKCTRARPSTRITTTDMWYEV